MCKCLCYYKQNCLIIGGILFMYETWHVHVHVHSIAHEKICVHKRLEVGLFIQTSLSLGNLILLVSNSNGDL
jgi:hypothetical protein